MDNEQTESLVDEPPSSKFKNKFYPDVSNEEWNDWCWQLKNRIKTKKQLEQFIELSEEEIEAIGNDDGGLPMSITPYYMSVVLSSPEHLRKAVIPTINEYIKSQGEAEDPLCEEKQSPVHGLVHRYPDRVLVMTHDMCSVYCRYCTRSRMAGRGDLPFDRKRMENILEYIENHTEVRDVILSGGDPLLLSEDWLDWILSRLRRIEHVEMIRIGTKVPVVLPQRITQSLVDMLKKYHPVWASIHFTHPAECTTETKKACEMLADAGLPLGSQTVLLKGINNDVETMRSLVHGLLKMRVRPYYLYQCDPIYGSSHFRTTIQDGLDIIKGLRGYTSGYGVPTYVIDAPGGGGKIPITPDYIVDIEDKRIILKNYEDKIYEYRE